MIWLLLVIPSAISNRIRGGWLATDIRYIIPFWSTTTSRLLFSAIVSFPIFITHNLNVSLNFYVLFFIGLLFRWSPWQFMDNPLHDIRCLTLRGLVLTAPCGFVSDLYWFGFSGCLMGLCYWLAYQLPFWHREKNGYLWVGSDWGELLFGGMLGLFIGINIYLL